MSRGRCSRAPEGVAAEVAASYRAMLPVLETERLILRVPEVEDFALWVRIFAEPGAEWIGGPLSPEEAWDGFAGQTACWLLHGHGPFVLHRRSDGARLGFVFLGYEWDDEEPELGWFLAHEFRNQGYGHEAGEAVRDWGLTLLPTFVSCVNPENKASTRLARGLSATLDQTASARLDTGIWRHGSLPQAEASAR
ncbi:MAG: GNAT family N-acetyltransferase [Pseudomonadota bacterium]